MLKYFIVLVVVLNLIACGKNKPNKLPILGEREFIDGDTIYHKTPDFSLMDQDSQIITNHSFDNYIYIADFFYTSCPTICPITGAQMARIQEKFKNEPRVKLLGFSIDYKYDSIPVLKKYSKKIGAIKDKWYFLQGDRNSISKLASDYFSVAKEDPTVPGGFDHSGRLILVDENKYVRSFCEGTDPEDVDRFMLDIEKLLNESKTNQ